MEWVAYKSPMPLKTQVFYILSAYVIGSALLILAQKRLR